MIEDATLYVLHIHVIFHSFDHDGLGRYGDPLNPAGDIDAMKMVSCVLKKDGLLFLTVPIGMVTDFTIAMIFFS